MQYLHRIIIIAFTVFITGCGTAREQVASDDPPEEKKQETNKEVSEQDRLQSTALLIDASRQKMLDNNSKAITLYHDAIQKDPSNDAAHYELARLHAQSGEYEDALKYAQTATSLDPQNMRYQMVLADVYTLKEEQGKAIEIHEALAREHPEQLDLREKLLNAYLRDEQYDKALEVLEHIESLQGPSRETSMQKERILITQGKMKEAIEEAQKNIKMFPEELFFYELLVDLYMDSDRHEEAKEVLVQMKEIAPDHHLVHLLHADFYHQQGDHEEAFSYLRVAFRSRELDIENKARIIYTYLQAAGEKETYLDQAMELGQILADTHPENPEAFFIFGDMLNMNGMHETARAQYLKGTDLDPSSLGAWEQILGISLRLSDYEALRDHSEEALEYFLEQPILFFFNGLAYLQLGNYEEAVSSLEYGLALIVDDNDLKEDFFTMLGDAYYQLKDHQQSDQYYERAIEHNPRNATALNNYSFHLAERKERLDEALQMAEMANRFEPDNPAFQDTYGWIKYQMGDFEEAKEWIQKAIETAEEPSADTLEHYGDVLYQLGERDKALEYWEKAKEKGSGSEFLNKKIEDHTLYE